MNHAAGIFKTGVGHLQWIYSLNCRCHSILVCFFVEKYCSRIMSPNMPEKLWRTTWRLKKTKECWLSWTFLHIHRNNNNNISVFKLSHHTGITSVTRNVHFPTLQISLRQKWQIQRLKYFEIFHRSDSNLSLNSSADIIICDEIFNVEFSRVMDYISCSSSCSCTFTKCPNSNTQISKHQKCLAC